MMETIRFGDAFKGEEHQAFKWRGSKRGALLVHGFPGTPAEMHPVARTLHEAGWTVHAPLLPGFGVEIDSLPERRAEDWLGCVRESLRALQAECEYVIIVGLSMGGALATTVGADESIDGLILLAPFWKLEHMLWGALPVLRYVLPTFKPFKLFKPNFEDEATREGILRFMPGIDLDDAKTRESILDFAIPVKMIDQVRRIGEMSYTHAGRVDVPTLIVQGRQDELVLPHLTRQLVRQFGHRVHYVEVDGAHELTDDRVASWREIEGAILGFLGK